MNKKIQFYKFGDSKFYPFQETLRKTKIITKLLRI